MVEWPGDICSVVRATHQMAGSDGHKGSHTQTVKVFNLTTHFSALGEVVAVVGYYHTRVKGMAAYFAVSVLIVTGVRIVFVGFDLSH
jgi:hypothetical protein